MLTDLTAVSGFLYLGAMIFYTGFIFFKKKGLGLAGTVLCVFGLLLHFCAFIMRWRDFYVLYGNSVFKSVPITNLYESLQFFSLLLMAIYIIFEFRSGVRVVGAFTAAVAGATLLFIDAVGASGNIRPLVPALQSNWLLAHVSLSFAAYVFFALSAISAFIYLILVSDKRMGPAYVFWTAVAGIATSGLFALIFDGVIACFNGDSARFRLFSATLNNGFAPVRLMFLLFTVFVVIFFWYEGQSIKKIFEKFNLNMSKLDMLAYKFAVMGFAVFTIGGLIFGAVWAERAWGRYWSWDPKETWAFITWAVYGVYLHGRLTERWSKSLANGFAVVGFILTIFTYLGVNLLLSGLHSYGGL